MSKLSTWAKLAGPAPGDSLIWRLQRFVTEGPDEETGTWRDEPEWIWERDMGPRGFMLEILAAKVKTDPENGYRIRQWDIQNNCEFVAI